MSWPEAELQMQLSLSLFTTPFHNDNRMWYYQDLPISDLEHNMASKAISIRRLFHSESQNYNSHFVATATGANMGADLKPAGQASANVKV